MQDLHAIDYSEPFANPPLVPITGFYIGGSTPHVWTEDEVKAIRSEFGLPIFVRTNPDSDANLDADYIIGWCQTYGWRPGETIAIDTEDVLMTGYLDRLNQRLSVAHIALLHYQSKGEVAESPPTSAGRWVADWTGTPHRRPGDNATQYASSTQTGLPFDQSMFAAAVRLHRLNSAPQPPVPQHVISVAVPSLYIGTSGQRVRDLQGLLNAHRGQAAELLMIDGEFGSLTHAALLAYQRDHVQTYVPGVAGPHTWAELITAG